MRIIVGSTTTFVSFQNSVFFKSLRCEVTSTSHCSKNILTMRGLVLFVRDIYVGLSLVVSIIHRDFQSLKFLDIGSVTSKLLKAFVFLH